MSATKKEIQRLSPAGAVTFTDAARADFIEEHGCLPPGLIYQITDGPDVGFWIAARNEGESDTRIVSFDDLNIPTSNAIPTEAPDGLPFHAVGTGAIKAVYVYVDGSWCPLNGLDGSDGADGTDGADGLSAYELWLAAGNTGTVDDFLSSLAGNEFDACDVQAATAAQAAAIVDTDRLLTCLNGTMLTVTVAQLAAALPSSGGTIVPADNTDCIGNGELGFTIDPTFAQAVFTMPSDLRPDTVVAWITTNNNGGGTDSFANFSRGTAILLQPDDVLSFDASTFTVTGTPNGLGDVILNGVRYSGTAVYPTPQNYTGDFYVDDGVTTVSATGGLVEVGASQLNASFACSIHLHATGNSLTQQVAFLKVA